MLAESRVLSRELDMFLKGGLRISRVMSSDLVSEALGEEAGEWDGHRRYVGSSCAVRRKHGK